MQLSENVINHILFSIHHRKHTKFFLKGDFLPFNGKCFTSFEFDGSDMWTKKGWKSKLVLQRGTLRNILQPKQETTGQWHDKKTTRKQRLSVFEMVHQSERKCIHKLWNFRIMFPSIKMWRLNIWSSAAHNIIRILSNYRNLRSWHKAENQYWTRMISGPSGRNWIENWYDCVMEIPAWTLHELLWK